jgi:hypothetical protein
MGIIFMIIAGICFGWWALTTVQDYWRSSMTSLIAQTSQADLMSVTPAMPPFSVDASKLVRAINPPVKIDTRAAERAAIEIMARQIDQQNRAAMSRVPLPTSIPGMPRRKLR